jgi:hypothetical protein
LGKERTLLEYEISQEWTSREAFTEAFTLCNKRSASLRGRQTSVSQSECFSHLDETLQKP